MVRHTILSGLAIARSLSTTPYIVKNIYCYVTLWTLSWPCHSMVRWLPLTIPHESFEEITSWMNSPSSMYETVSKPRCGWSGNPAPSLAFPANSSSMRNGSRFCSSGRPMDRRTRAPRPSPCQTLSRTFSTSFLRKSTKGCRYSRQRC